MEKMSIKKFTDSLRQSDLPAGLSPQAQAIWFAGKGDWNHAHEIVQDLTDPLSERIHGYLHRREGDRSNAGYWYSRAGVPFPALTLEEEWTELARLAV
jgi:hypothetical protein